MRILFSAVPVAGHVLPMWPMIAAAASDGHEVAVLTSADLAGLLAPHPVLAAGPPMGEQVAETVRRVGGRWTGPGPEAAELFAGTRVDLTLDEARVHAEKFGPDLIVCDTLDFVGPTLAAGSRVPWAVHGIAGGLPPHFGKALDERWSAQLEQRGLNRTTRLAYVDPYPDPLHGAGTPQPPDRLPVRVLPFDQVGAVYEPPAFGSPGPRVLVTLGTTVDDPGLEPELARSLASAGFNVLVTGSTNAETAPDDANIEYVGFVPLARILPEVDLVVTAGGTGTVLSALALGLPLVIRPVMADHPFNAARAEKLGAALTISEPSDAGQAARSVLNDPAFRQAAREVQAHNEILPSPADVLRSLIASV